MACHVGIAAVDLGIVEAGLDDSGFQIVRHYLSRHTAEIEESAAMGADPVGQALRPAGLRWVGLRMVIRDGVHARESPSCNGLGNHGPRQYLFRTSE